MTCHHLELNPVGAPQDPYLITRMAVTANRAMQQPVQDNSGRTFLKTSQTTRHYMGYHQSNQMPIPAINVTERDLRFVAGPSFGTPRCFPWLIVVVFPAVFTLDHLKADALWYV